MTTFTASEVRELAATIWPDLRDREEVAEMLHAFSDRLEADEKAVPVAWLIHAPRNRTFLQDAKPNLTELGWGAEPLYTHPASADAEKRETMTPRELAKRIERGEKWKLADEPAPCQSHDTERLAEALRNLVSEWVVIADDGDATLEDSTIGYRACANRLSAMLAAYSAQAHPPAASVTDAMKRAFEHLASIGYPKNARGNYDKDGEWTFSDAVPRDVDAREVSAAFHALKAALAAQENPNG